MAPESLQGDVVGAKDLEQVLQDELEEELRLAASRASRSYVRRAVSRYIGARVAQGVLVVYGAVTVSFILIHATGNPATILAGGILPPAQLRALSARLGYSRPILDQYGSYIAHVLQGNFGDSFRYGTPAINSVMAALPNTLLLVAISLAAATIISVVIATSSVLSRGGWSERVWRPAVLAVQGIPDFWIALILVWVFSVKLGVLPSLGFVGPDTLIMPCAALTLPMLASFTRLLRVRLLDFTNSDVALAMQTRGLTRREIVLHHALRNSMATFVSYVALQAGWLIGGTIIVETIFSWPGIGSLLLSAVLSRDLTVIQAIVVVIAVAFTAFNLLADLAVLWIDPRIVRAPSGGSR